MKTINGMWFEVTVKCTKIQEDGTVKTVKETYAINTLTFADAEEKGIKTCSNEDAAITAIQIAAYTDVTMNDTPCDKYFKAKVEYIVLDEKTGKEKTMCTVFLIEADSVDNTAKIVHEQHKGCVADYRIASIVKTKIVRINND